MACTCPSGQASFMLCSARQEFGACGCGDAGSMATDAGVDGRGEGGATGAAGAGGAATGGAVAAGGGMGGATGSGGRGDGGSGEPAPTGCVPGGKLIGGNEVLVDLYVVDAGILVVRADALLLIGRDGVVKKTVPAPRPITSASFDGTRLVAADAAMITVYTPALDPLGTVLLTEACVSSVLVSGGVFVCGPVNDWDRIFYTYDVVGMKAIARSSKAFTYHGRPMRRVPGTDYFVTVTTDLSPSDYYLYKVAPAGADVTYVNESPYHGDFAATMTFAFDKVPAEHLLNLSGLMLRIFGDGCDSQHNSFTSGCFVKDGTLGILPAGGSYLAMTNDAAGRLFTVVGSGSGYPSALCPGGCTLQLIDVAARVVVSQRRHQMAARGFIALRPDTSCKMVAVGYSLATSTSSFDYSGYQIDFLDYGGP